MIFFNFQQANH